jgi:uncharacterized protein YacL
MAASLEEKPAPTCPLKIVVFTGNLLVGLAVSQLIPSWLHRDDLHIWTEVVQCFTMFTLCYIMINGKVTPIGVRQY